VKLNGGNIILRRRLRQIHHWDYTSKR